MFVFMVLLFILLPPEECGAGPITCFNDQGSAVDWFYLYKLPKHGGIEGLRYLLLEEGSEGWSEGKADINSTAGAPGRTVGQLYGGHKEVAYILYNDQHPLRPGPRRGHTKGVVLLDKTQGFWLVHSTPKFPPPRSSGQYAYPDTGMRKGQSFLCVTYPLERFQTIGEQLQINQPNVYDCDVPPSLATVVPALAALCPQGVTTNHVFPHVKPVTNRSMTLTSLGGTKFLNFAKGASFNNELYESWVAPTLQSHLLVRLWICSKGVLPSKCSGPWKIVDVQLAEPGQSFPINETHDHSKWAVSTQAPGGSGGGGGWVCVGDMNRNRAENQRGGGTVCQQNPLVWKAYRSAALRCKCNDTCDVANYSG